MPNRTKEQLKKHYKEYQGKPEQIKNRAARNKARAEMVKAGKAHKGDGKDVGHQDSNPRNNSKSNLKILPVAAATLGSLNTSMIRSIYVGWMIKSSFPSWIKSPAEFWMPKFTPAAKNKFFGDSTIFTVG